VAAKTLHVGAYAFLTVMAAWLRVPVRYRFLLIFFLMAHATVTEVLQQVLVEIVGRTGSLWDVALDQLGITLGLLLAWRWWVEHDNPNKR
jgi:hypothetical protein